MLCNTPSWVYSFIIMVKPKQTEPPIDDAILLLTIEELRRALSWLDHAYDKVKTKTLTFLGGGLAVLTFLYASGDLFFPEEFYGRIFYVTGLALMISAIIMLFMSMWPRIWEFTIDSDDLEDMNFTDKSHYIQYVKSNYMKAYKSNSITYAKNHRILHRAFFPLVAGAIILVVLKIFGA